jgi:hypothetical protein
MSSPHETLDIDLANWFDEDTRIDMKVYTIRQPEPVYLVDVLANSGMSNGWLIVESRTGKHMSYFPASTVLYLQVIPVENGLPRERD